jgi:AraC-like DNA-binding protein
MERADHETRKPMIRLGAGAAIPALLRGFGLEPAAFFHERGFDVARFEDPDLPVAYAALADLASGAADATGCEHFGLLVGHAADLRTLGGIGLEAARAPNAGAALRLIAARFDAHDRGAIVTFDEAEDVSLSYSVIDPAVVSAGTMVDGAMAAAMRIMTELCGPSFAPSAVCLPRRAPRDRRPYARAFRCRVSFDAPTARMHFDRRWLSLPLRRQARMPSASADGRLPPIMQGDPIVRVRVEIGRRLATGGEVSVASVAQALGMSRRTLHRELAKGCTTYHSIVDDVRFAFAKRLLHDTGMSLTEIAVELGYSELSAFTRAFARFFGACPSAWRGRHGLSPFGVTSATRSPDPSRPPLFPNRHETSSEGAPFERRSVAGP